MATKQITLANGTLKSEYYASWDSNAGYGTTTPSIGYYGNTTIDMVANGIPSGSTINSVTQYALYTSALHGYNVRDTSINGTKAHAGNWASGNTALDKALITGDTFVFNMRFKSGTSGTTYPPYPNAPSKKNSSSVDYTSISLTIDYTEPYSACQPPSWVSVSPTSVASSGQASLSWGGAGEGTNNGISSYDVYYSDGAGWVLWGNTSATTLPVTGRAENGTSRAFCVITVGSVSGYNSGYSSSTATLTTSWSDATPPNSVTGPTNVVPGTTQTITWSGAGGGTNNPIVRYELYYDFGNYVQKIGETTNAYLNVTSHSTNGSSYTYKVLVVAERNTVMSTAYHIMTSYVAPINPPSSVSFDANNLGPGGTTVLRWSGAYGGTNNSLNSYDVEYSDNGGASWHQWTNTGLQEALSVTSSETNNATRHFRIKANGERSTAYSGAAGLVTTVTKPGAPTSVSLNDNGLPVGYSKPLTLSWSGASGGTNNPIYGYRVMVSTNDGGLTQYESDIVTGHDYGAMQVNSLGANGTQVFYVYTIGATSISAEQLSALSTDNATLTTTVTNPGPPTLSVPTNVAPGSQQSLSWWGATNGTNNGITTYHIYRSVDGAGWEFLGEDGTSPFTVTAHGSNGGTIAYIIYAIAPHGNSINSASVTMTTTVTQPKAPTTVLINGAESATNLAPDADVTLSWSGAANADYNNAVDGYSIMRSIDGGAYGILVSYLPASTTSYTVKTKNGNGSHAYRIIAVGASSLGINSDMSAKIATATTVVSTPSAPAIVEVVNGGGVAPGSVRTLRWSNAAAGTYNNPIKGYQIYRSTASESGYVEFGSPILTANTYYDGLLVEAPSSDGGSFYYKIVTLGATLGINSGMSVAGVLTTQKLPSTATLNKAGLTATGSDSITLTISPQLSSYTHRVIWYIPDANGGISAYNSDFRTKAAGVTTDTYTIPQSWIAATKLATSVTGWCMVDTYDGGTHLGANWYSYTVYVPAKSSFTLSGVPLTANGSNAATVNIAPTYTGYKHTVVWSAGGYSTSHTIAAGTASPSKAYAIPEAWCNSVPNNDSFIVSVTVTTIKVTAEGEISLGETGNTFSAVVPSNILPSITNFYPTVVTPHWGQYVRTKSSVNWAVAANGAYSSTIVSYKITHPALNSGVIAYTAGANWTSGTLDTSGVQTFTLTVTDSRGRTASAQNSVTVANYSAPIIASSAFVRYNESSTPPKVDRLFGTSIQLTASFSFTEIGTNAINANAYFKEIGTATWSAPIAITISGTGPNRAGTVIFGGGAIAIDKLYDVMVALADHLGSVSVSSIVPTVTRVFDFREGKAAFGGIAAINNSLQVPLGWKMHIGGNEVFHDGRILPVANGGTGATDAATARYNLGTDSVYLKLSGGTMTGTITNNVAVNTSADILYGTMGINDQYRIRAGGASDAGYLEIATADGGTEPIYVRQYTGVFGTVARTLTLLDGSGNTSVPGTLTIGGATALTTTDRGHFGRWQTKKTVNIAGGANTYYPVLIQAPSALYGFNTYSISRYYADVAPDTWNTPTHKGALTLTWKWSGDIGWGGNYREIRIEAFNEQYSTMVGGMTLAVFGIIVWLRGGGANYDFESEFGDALPVTPFYTDYVDPSGVTYSPRTTVDTSYIYSRWPVRQDHIEAYNLRVNNEASFSNNNGIKWTWGDGSTSARLFVSSADAHLYLERGGANQTILRSDHWSPFINLTTLGAAASEHSHPGMDLIRPAGTGVQPNNQCLLLSGSVYTSGDIVQAPGLGFHIPGVTWSTIKMDSSGDFRFYNSTLSGYQSVRAANFYENDVALSSKYLSLGGGTLTGDLTGKNITSANTSFSATLGRIACTWAGDPPSYPTLYGSAPERWVMHINPHIVYVQNGTHGYTGAMNGATIRFGSDAAANTAWDIGVGVLGNSADTFAIGRRTSSGVNTPFLTFDNSGYAHFAKDMQIGTYPDNPKTLSVRHIDGIAGANWENGALYLNYHTNQPIKCRAGAYINIDSGNWSSYITLASIGAAASGHGHTSGYYNSPLLGGADLNNHLTTGIFGWAGMANAPYPYGQGINIVSDGNSHNNVNNWITQLGFGTNGEGYFRTKVNGGGWDGWRTILTTANYTSYVTPGSIGAAPANHGHTTLDLNGTDAMIMTAGGGLNTYGAPAGRYPVAAYEAYGWNFTVQQIDGSSGKFRVVKANRSGELLTVSESGQVTVDSASISLGTRSLRNISAGGTLPSSGMAVGDIFIKT